MSFEVRIQLRDTTVQCADEDKMNEVFDDVLKDLIKSDVPSDNIILIGAELHTCNMGHIHNQVIRRHPPTPEP